MATAFSPTDLARLEIVDRPNMKTVGEDDRENDLPPTHLENRVQHSFGVGLSLSNYTPILCCILVYTTDGGQKGI